MPASCQGTSAETITWRSRIPDGRPPNDELLSLLLLEPRSSNSMRITSLRSKRRVRPPPNPRRSSHSMLPLRTAINSPCTRDPSRRYNVSARRLRGSASRMVAHATHRALTDICVLLVAAALARAYDEIIASAPYL